MNSMTGSVRTVVTDISTGAVDRNSGNCASYVGICRNEGAELRPSIMYVKLVVDLFPNQLYYQTFANSRNKVSPHTCLREH